MLKPVLCVAIALAFAVPVQAEESKDNRILSDSLGWLVGTWKDASSAADSQSDATTMSFRRAAGDKVVLMEGTYVAKEATWSFAAVFFYDPVKERIRVFSFNSDGQRHMGILTAEGPGKLAWGMSGLLPDGSAERFVMKFVQGEGGTLDFHLKDRRPTDGESDAGSTVTLRKTAVAG